MNTLYLVILVIHVLSAAAGYGPLFQASIIRKPAKNVQQMQHSLEILKRTSKAPRHSVPVMAVTGILLVVMGHFQMQGWLLTAILLFGLLTIILFAILPTQLRVLEELIAAKSQAAEGALSVEMNAKAKKLQLWERISASIVALIFVLMTARPF